MNVVCYQSSREKREIFAGRAMVDQARECLCYQKKLNILEYLTLKSLPVLSFGFYLDNCVLLTVNHINNDIFLLSCLTMKS